MGSFNVGCGLSQLTIESGDRVGFVLIAPERFTYYGGNHTVPHQPWFHLPLNRSFGLYTSDHYTPIAPPVYGTYADYGRVDSITPSPTVEYLEGLFNAPVETIVNMAGNESCSIYDYTSPLYEKFFITELKDRFEAAIKRSSQDKLADIAGVLTAVGFVLQSESLSDTAHAYVWSEADWISIILEPNPTGSVYPQVTIKHQANSLKTVEKRVDYMEAEDILQAYSDFTGNYPGYDTKPVDRVYALDEDGGLSTGQSVGLLSKLGGMFFSESIHESLKAQQSEWLVSPFQHDKPVTEEEWSDFIGLVQQRATLQKEEGFSINTLSLVHSAISSHPIGRKLEGSSDMLMLASNRVHLYDGFLDNVNDLLALEKELDMLGLYWQPSRTPTESYSNTGVHKLRADATLKFIEDREKNSW